MRKMKINGMNILFVFIFHFVAQQSFAQTTQKQFRKSTLTTDFISEGVAVGDVNHDGKLDIMAGSCWFEAPEWKRHQIAPEKIFNPETDYSNSFLNHAADVNQDGWIDLLVVDFPGTYSSWFENPKNKKDSHWKEHRIYEPVGNESPAFVDVDGDGKVDLLCADSNAKQLIWLKSPTSTTNLVWEKFTISEINVPGTDIFSHGLGYGDINMDGRSDVMIREGWWEGPNDPKQASWKFHEANLGDQCSQMYTLDVNGDGLMDVFSASAHLSGVWWHEQMKDGTWEQHVISYAFAESHAVAKVDLNGDGQPDFVTGKRNLKRNTWRKNPGTHGPPLLYWFEFTPGVEPYWIEHQIDNESGAGLNIATADMNADGRMDIVIANFKGVFLFENSIEK